MKLTPTQEIVVTALRKGGRLRAIDRRKIIFCTLTWRDGSKDSVSMNTVKSLIRKGVIVQRPAKMGDLFIDYQLKTERAGNAE